MNEYERLCKKTKLDILLTLFPLTCLISPTTISIAGWKQRQCLLEKSLKNGQPPILLTVREGFKNQINYFRGIFREGGIPPTPLRGK